MVAFYSPGDQELYKQFQYLPQEKFRLGLNLPKAEQDVSAVNTSFGIPATNAFTGNNQNNNYYTGTTGSLVSGFNQAVTDRQNRLEALNMPLEQKGVRGADITMETLAPIGAPENLYEGSIEGIPQTIRGAPGVYQAGAKNTIGRKISDFVYGLPGFNKPQSARDILESGYTGTGSGPGLMAAILGKFDQYGNLPRVDQAFISSRMGYTGPTVFGANQSGISKDPFGINTRSAFGNYAEYTVERADELEKSIEKSKANWESKYGDLNNVNQFGKTWSEMNKNNLNMFDFYSQGAQELKDMKEKDYQDRIDKFVTNYSRPEVKQMFEETYDGTNIHGGNDTTGATTTTGSGDGFTGSGDFSNIDNSGKDYGPHSKGDGNKSGGKTGGHSGSGYQGASGSHHYKKGGLASIL